MRTSFFLKNVFLFKDDALFLELSGSTNPIQLGEIKNAY